MITAYRLIDNVLTESLVDTKENFSLKDLVWLSVFHATDSEKGWLYESIGFRDQPRKHALKFLKVSHGRRTGLVESSPEEELAKNTNESPWVDLGRCRIIEVSPTAVGYSNAKISFYYLKSSFHPVLLTIGDAREISPEFEAARLSFKNLLEDAHKYFRQHWDRQSDNIIPLLIFGAFDSLLRSKIQSLEVIEETLNKVGAKILKNSPVSENSGKRDAKITTKTLKSLIKDLGRSQETISHVIGNITLFNNLIETVKSEVRGVERGHSSSESDASAGSTILWQHDMTTIIQFCKALSARAEYLGNVATSITSLQQNEGNQVLTLIAGMFVVPNLITGFMGMNFNAPPDVKWQIGMPAALFLCAGIAYGIYRYFKSRWDL